MIGCACHGCVCLRGERNGCHLLRLNPDKPYHDLAAQGSLCALWPGSGKISKNSAIHAAPIWMRSPGRQVRETKMGQRAWLFQGKPMGPHVSSKKFPFCILPQSPGGSAKTLAIHKMDQFFLGGHLF